MNQRSCREMRPGRLDIKSYDFSAGPCATRILDWSFRLNDEIDIIISVTVMKQTRSLFPNLSFELEKRF